MSDVLCIDCSRTGKTQRAIEELAQALDAEAAVSPRIGSVGYHFWQEEFLRQAREFLHRQEEQRKERNKQKEQEGQER